MQLPTSLKKLDTRLAGLYALLDYFRHSQDGSSVPFNSLISLCAVLGTGTYFPSIRFLAAQKDRLFDDCGAYLRNRQYIVVQAISHWRMIVVQQVWLPYNMLRRVCEQYRILLYHINGLQKKGTSSARALEEKGAFVHTRARKLGRQLLLGLEFYREVTSQVFREKKEVGISLYISKNGESAVSRRVEIAVPSLLTNHTFPQSVD